MRLFQELLQDLGPQLERHQKLWGGILSDSSSIGATVRSRTGGHGGGESDAEDTEEMLKRELLVMSVLMTLMRRGQDGWMKQRVVG